MAFKKGEGGRPRGASNRATKDLKDVLAQLCLVDKTGKAGNTDLHASRLHDLTQSTDEHVAIKALTLVMAYRYGKPVEHHQIGGEGGGPVIVRFVDADA